MLEALDRTGKTITVRSVTIAEDYVAVSEDDVPVYEILLPEVADED